MRQVKHKVYFKNEFKILNDFIKMKLIDLELLKIYSILI